MKKEKKQQKFVNGVLGTLVLHYMAKSSALINLLFDYVYYIVWIWSDYFVAFKEFQVLQEEPKIIINS